MHRLSMHVYAPWRVRVRTSPLTGFHHARAAGTAMYRLLLALHLLVQVTLVHAIDNGVGVTPRKSSLGSTSELALQSPRAFDRT